MRAVGSLVRQDGVGPTRDDGTARTSQLESELGFRLGRAHRALREAWGAQIVDLDVTPPQAAMLRAVCEQPGSGVRELGRLTHTDAMNAKRLVDHLERSGLVGSVADPRHRQRRVLRPTVAGEALAGQVSSRADAWNRRLAHQLGPDGVRALEHLLGLLEAAAEHPGGHRRDGDGPAR